MWSRNALPKAGPVARNLENPFDDKERGAKIVLGVLQLLCFALALFDLALVYASNPP